jgi:hypothetical protein
MDISMNTFFLLSLVAPLGLLFFWSFHHLQKERWQFIGALPAAKLEDGSWKGTPITFYGLFNALAYVFATGLFCVLLGAAGGSLTSVLLAVVVVLGICVPASKRVAFWVEGKKHTFSVGGAFFIGIIAGPWILLLLQKVLDHHLGVPLPAMAAMAAVAIAYAFGEGIGRLACISFGCCYGKPLSALPSWLAGVLSRGHLIFTFSGKTKKIAYADGLDQHQIVPVQGITAILYCTAGTLATHFFLEGRYPAAFMATILITQVWRFFSEFLRTDYRGHNRISAYQIMAIIGAVYAVLVAVLIDWPSHGYPMQPDILKGLTLLWNPLVLLILQGLGVMIFLFTGRSQVTGAVIRFHVHEDRI